MDSSSAARSETSASLDPVVAEVRTRFVADFPIRCDRAAALVDGTADPATRMDAARTLRGLAHTLAGLAGTVGFHRVSALAADLECQAGELEGGTADPRRAHDTVESIRAAFVQELATPPAGSPAPSPAADRGVVLVIDDDDEQRAVVMSQLSTAGFRTHGLSSGTAVCRTVRALSPTVVLLDVQMPDRDGYAVCRELKADPELAAVPVVFMTTRSRLDDRLTGLTLGADDYLVKPVDPGELVIRLERLTARAAAHAEEAGSGAGGTYRDFLEAARGRAGRSPVSCVLMRVPADRIDVALARVRDEIRRADLVAAYDRAHLVLLLPDLTGAAAVARVEGVVDRLVADGIDEVRAGIACTAHANGASVETLLADADHALMQARYCGRPVMLHGESVGPDARPAGASILVADDDPDVVRILDAALRGGGYRTTLVFDGVEALASLDHDPPNVLVLDLMMPRLGGFDLLHRLRGRQGPRPKVVVLSARGREDDVMRAFELGADDYVTKPFNPRELTARVARLLR